MRALSCVLSPLDSREHVRDGAWGGARVCDGEAVLWRWPKFCGAGRRVRIRAYRDLRRLSPSHAGAVAPPTPAVCSLGVNPVGAARVRSGRGWQSGAARCAGARLWRSCASGVQCMAQLAVEMWICGSRGAAPKGRARALALADGGRRVVFVVHCSWSYLALAAVLSQP